EVPGKVWLVILAPPFRMQNRGLPSEMLKPGTTVTVVGYPNRTDPAEMRAERISVNGKTTELREERTVEHGGGPAWALALERSEFGQAIRESLWIYPSANVLHVLAIGLLLGSIVVFDLRVLGKGKNIAPDRLARLVLPVSATALALAAPTGFLLF